MWPLQKQFSKFYQTNLTTFASHIQFSVQLAFDGLSVDVLIKKKKNL